MKSASALPEHGRHAGDGLRLGCLGLFGVQGLGLSLFGIKPGVKCFHLQLPEAKCARSEVSGPLPL